MKKIILGVLILLFFAGCHDDDYEKGIWSPESGANLSPKVDGRIVGTYVTWYETEDNKSIPDANYFTHLFYAFAELYIDANGVYQGFKLQGSESRFSTIVNLKKKNPDLKISIAFSHTVENPDNKQAGGFSLLAKSDEYRKAFANDCKAFLEEWGIDGVDMDWEFPGLSWSGHAADPAVDVQNHVLLMRQLRETLGNRYLLTYAGYVRDKQQVSGGWRYIDIAAVEPYVDFVNIMTYDMDEAPRHQSALEDASAYWDCKRAVKSYIDAGVPANKLVLGIPFYGRISFSSSPGSINYNKIVKLDTGEYKIDNWDNNASVPYVTTADGKYYCGYDNERSIAIKGEWMLSQGMRGMMYWDYNGDDTKGTLRTAVWEATMKK